MGTSPNPTDCAIACEPTPRPPVLLLRPGLVEYGAAWDLQRALAAARRDGRAGDALILLEHPHVYTLGRNADEAHVLVDPARLADLGATLFRTDRGGDVTYHGPGQLVGYPILDLKARGADVHRYVREIEEVIIRALADFGIASERVAGLPGVWVGREKVAAIGVKIARWISGHGFALNVSTDLSFFEHIVPCGLHDRGVTSISQLLGREVTVEAARECVERRFAEVFGCELAPVADISGLVEDSGPLQRRARRSTRNQRDGRITVDVLEAIGARRSIRRFRSDPVPDELIRRLLSAAIQAPSGKNRQPWRFVVVRGEQRRAEMVALMREGIADLRAQGVDVGSAEGTTRAMAQAAVTVFIYNPFGKKFDESRSFGDNIWETVDVQSVGAAIEHICLAATALGLGTLWICDVFVATERFGSWLGQSGLLVAAVSIGYPDESPGPRPRKAMDEVTTWL